MDPETALLERRGDAWSIELSPRVLTVRHSRGMRHLSRLLEHPGEEVHVLELRKGGPVAVESADRVDVERAQLEVRRAIRGAIRRVAKFDPPLGMHLERSVKTGIYCSYQGSVERPIVWSVEAGED